MESPKTPLTDDGLRLRLIFKEKFRVIEARIHPLGGKEIKIALGGSTTLTAHIPTERADVRAGDLLTFYTEVPLAKPS